MHSLLALSLIIILVFVFYQDLKYRAVYWFLFPVLLAMSYFYIKDDVSPIEWAFNAGFILLQLLGIGTYLSLKEKKLINFIDTHLGLGDILFFAVLTLWFSPINFILFFISSLVISLLSLAITQRQNFSSFKVPLAGIHAILLAVIIVLKETLFPHVLTNNWITL